VVTAGITEDVIATNVREVPGFFEFRRGGAKRRGGSPCKPCRDAALELPSNDLDFVLPSSAEKAGNALIISGR
jgi:hypothetical protein